MITNAMRATLVDELGYSDEEVDVMRPEIAAQLIERGTRRPFGDRPMPDSWRRGGPTPARGGGGVSGLLGNNLVRLALLGLTALGLALANGKLEIGTLLGGAPLGRKPLKKLKNEVKRSKKKSGKKAKTLHAGAK